MTVRQFLSCAYAMLTDAYLRLGSDMLTAIEKVDESIGLRSPSVQLAQERTPTASDNDRALAELKKMMGGLRV